MKVLVVNYYYSWSSSVGSRRMRGLVKGLVAAGHDAAVVGARAPEGMTAPDIPGVTFLSTPPTDRVLVARALVARAMRRGATSRSPSQPPAVPLAPATAAPVSLTQRIRRAVTTSARRWVGFPDTMWEWTHRAQRVVRNTGMTPDVIVASAPPMAGLHAASWLARRLGCRWVADMRDLWTGDPYRITPSPVRPLDRWLERRVLSTAAAVTTVAASMVDELSTASAGAPVTVLRNGFDADWLRPGSQPARTPPRIVYTGTLTANTGRSLDELCDAVEAMRATAGTAAPVVHIVGATDRRIVDLVQRRGLTDSIVFDGVVGADAAREAQHEATALLNFSWEDPRDFHKLPAKVFEYAASRRPIIHLGKVETLGTQLIRDHGLGFVVDPDDTDAVARLMLGLSDGTVEWTPPTPDDLAPLSQQAMVEGFLRVIESVSRDRS